jgi:hypothetical protein
VETLSLTYAELADRLGIEREAARQLVKRRRWMKWKGNDGQVRISVPEEAVGARSETGLPPGDEPGTDRIAEPVVDRAEPGVLQVLSRHIERLEQALESAQKRANDLERERDEARTEAKAQAVIAAQVNALQAVLSAERQRVEEWKSVADRFAAQAEALATRPTGLFALFRRRA